MLRFAVYHNPRYQGEAPRHSRNEWGECEVTHDQNGNISVTVTDASGSTIASLSATDSTYTSGGIGFTTRAGFNRTSQYFDYYRIP